MNHTYHTVKKYNLQFNDIDRTAGKYQIPTLEPETMIPTDIVDFNWAFSHPGGKRGVHFYIDDYRFERIWACPGKYLEHLAEFECVLTPDFSLYMDMPLAMKIWNVYRSRLIGQIMQDYGIPVIPTLQWAGEDTFEFVFDGLPKNSVVSISTVGVARDKEAMKIFDAGCSQALKILKPTDIILFGSRPDYDFGSAKVHEYRSIYNKRMKRIRSKK